MTRGHHIREAMFSRLATALAGTLAVVAGSMVLVGWAIDHTVLKSLLPGWVSVKPNTALAFVLTGMALLLSTSLWPSALRLPPTGRLSRLGRFCGMLAGLIGLVTLVEYLADWNPGLDQWLFPEPAGTVGTSHPGRMAPDTALCFVLLAAGLEFLQGMRPTTRGPVAAAMCGGLVATLALTAIMSYFAGVLGPYGWWGLTIMAVPTAAVFFVLGLTMILMAWEQSHVEPGLPVEANAAAGRRAKFATLLVLLLLAGGVVTTSTSNYRAYAKRYRAEVEAQLTAIAELKVGELTQWRKERRGDAAALAGNPALAALVQRAFAAAPDGEATRQLQGWIGVLQKSYEYDRVVLLDARGTERMAAPTAPETRVEDRTEAAAQALRTGQVIFWDFHRHDPAGPVHLGLLVPIVDVSGGGAPLGVIVQRIDPTRYLYPLLQKWPTPSATGETLLVRREGDEVVFLNELRHRRGTALNLRRSVHEAQLPAAKGAIGQTGIGEGVDYRGVKVVAVSRAIPDSPWVMIAKEDEVEVYAPLRREAWRMGGLVALLLLTTAFGGVAFWRHKNESLLRDALRQERASKALAERLAVVMRHANDIILLLDETGRIFEANDRALATYGYTLEEIRRLPPGGLRPPATADQLPEQLALFDSAGGAIFETIHRRKDGTMFPVEVSGRAVEIEGRHFSLGVYRDVTQRKAHEAEIQRLNRLYGALSQVNQVILRARTREELFHETCEVLVEFGWFKLAWIGWMETATAAVKVVGQAGDETGYLRDIRVFAEDRPEGRGPVGTCIREGRTDVCNDFATDPRTAPWHEPAARAGFAAIIALPIRVRGEVQGALTVYAAEKGAFGDKEITLLEEAAVDVSFGIDHLETERLRRRAEEQYRSIFEHAIEGIFQTTPQGNIVTANPAMARILGYPSPAALIRERTDVARQGFVDPRRREEFIRRIEAEGTVSGFEYEAHRRDGSRVWVSENARVVRSEHGHAELYEGSLEDITERKRAEQALAGSERRFQVLAEVSPTGIFRTDAQGRTTYVNPRWCQIAGLAAGEAMGDGWLRAVHPDDRVKVAEGWQVATAAHRSSTVDYRFVHADGTVLWVMGQAGPETDAEGRVVGYVGTVIDLTERKRNEAAMAEQLDELRRWHDAMLGRESRVLAMKQEVNALLARLGEPPRYGSTEEKEGEKSS